MQGTLNEIDLRSILQLIAWGQRTGELLVEAATGKTWLVFFENGKFVYAAEPDDRLRRLQDYLRYCQVPTALDLDPHQVQSIASINVMEYGCLWMLLEQRRLAPEQARLILARMLEEVLFDLMSLHQGTFKFELGPALSPQLTLFEVAPLVAQVMVQVQEWKQFYPYVRSPEQRLTLVEPERLQTLLPPSLAHRLCAWAEGQTSIRQLARLLGRDLVALTRLLYPYVRQGLVQWMPSQSPEHPVQLGEPQGSLEPRPVPRIVCVDDSLAIRKAVEGILSRHGYEVSAIANPLKALSLVFQLKPDLILCDITMPELDGHELCAMLRSATAFRHTPIIMLTVREGFLDRAKARLAGATDYLTKPFKDEELLMLIESYVGPGDLNRPNPDKLLAEALREELLLASSSSTSISSASTSALL